CSDGLTAVLDEAQIAKAMQQDLTSAVKSLIELTYKAGAPDNVTVIVAEIGEIKASIKTQGFGAAL
ncbi:MAG: serine/threonine protein phosphatase, partial [Actinomycetota bacterium]